MLKEIAHIGIAVTEIDKSLRIYRDILKMKVVDRKKLPDHGLEICMLTIADGSCFELLQPLDNNSAIAKALEKRGQGIHHICFHVDNIAAALKELESQGIELIDREPRPGASGELIAFLHPQSTGGLLIELEQKMPNY